MISLAQTHALTPARKPVAIEKYVAASRKLDLDGIDFTAVAQRPLPLATLQSLIYMADVEGSTVTFLRDVMATSLIDDPDIARFLTLWAYEEMFHQEALVKFLAAYGVELDNQRVTRIRAKQTFADRLMMKLAAWVSHISDDFLPIYLTWGAINELSTLHAYQRLGEQSGHPVLVKLTSRIAKDERRHFSFYFQRARNRLEKSAGARRWVSWAVRLFWQPVGDGLKSKDEVDCVLRGLLDGPEGLRRAREMDQIIAELPGLHWFDRWERHWRRLNQTPTAVVGQRHQQNAHR